MKLSSVAFLSQMHLQMFFNIKGVHKIVTKMDRWNLCGLWKAARGRDHH